MITLQATQKPRNVLPKTGQTTSYQAGDDGDYEAGWWRKRLNANNKTRFVAKTIAGGNVICDYATRLMWKASDEGGSYTWVNALIQAEGLTYAGFSDWKLPNVAELFSVFDYSTRNPYVILGMSMEAEYWTSTTDAFAADKAAQIGAGELIFSLKTITKKVRVCREF